MNVFVSGKVADSTLIIAIVVGIGAPCFVVIVIAILIYCLKKKNRYSYMMMMMMVVVVVVMMNMSFLWHLDRCLFTFHLILDFCRRKPVLNCICLLRNVRKSYNIPVIGSVTSARPTIARGQ